MIPHDESLAPELAALLATIHRDQLATADTPIFMDDLLELGRRKFVRFDAQGRLTLTSRGQEAMLSAKKEDALAV
jgi:hypothetical protein